MGACGAPQFTWASLLDQCLKVGREVPCVLPSREVVPIVVMGL